MDLAGLITKELGIPKNYIKNYETKKNRSFVVVHRDWIASLLSCNEVPDFITHETRSGDEIQALFYENEDQANWHKLLIHVVVKPNENELVIPLPRPRTTHSTNEAGLSYAQLLHYISETNFKNGWKHFYKKYIGMNVLKGDKTQSRSKEIFKGSLINKNNDILIEIIKRFYGCKIVVGNNFDTQYYLSNDIQTEYEPHPNILPALCAIEAEKHFLIIHHMDQVTTLKDCLTFTPMLINSNYTKALFIIYQMLQVMKNSHDRGLFLGNLQLDEIFLNEGLFIQVIPNLQENICKLSEIDCETPENVTSRQTHKVGLLQNYTLSKLNNFFPLISQNTNLKLVCNKWINREISNFDYLMYLNHVAGRRFGDPSCHFIMPWVSDFATRANGNWRDLSKSKFRLNKGDRQLDFTYENAVNSSQIPHHVSDVLSEITYYVYLSRRTPRSLLCKHVRSVWVPAEYPSSIQRLQEWTPDECIPEFFYDPTIFKSIHEDLSDLELPHWALTPEEFIEAHRECLESRYVSERLHHWIDLTFGYKLSGSAAVKSKNVCLHLVESHKNLKTSGVVQLFSYPHPPKQFQVQFFEKVPPKVLYCYSSRQPKVSTMQSERITIGSEDEGHSSGNGDDDSFGTKSSPLIFSKLITRSKGSLLAPFQSSNEETSRSEHTKSSSGGGQSSNSSATIILPKEYNPSGLLTSVETNQNFFRKTFLTQATDTSAPEPKTKLGLKQTIANKRIQEMQVLGCLIIEIFLQSKLRVLNEKDLDKRVQSCVNFLTNDSLPRCVRSALNLLFQPFKDIQNQPYITASGLPPPSAHQFLQPLLSSFVIPFPILFPVIYPSICNLISCSKAVTKYEFWNPQGNRVKETLNVLKVKKFSVDLEKIWEELLSRKNEQMIELLFPFFKELFNNPLTSRLSVILFLDKVCRSLGPKHTNELLLETIINLYNSNSYDASENLCLYHKNFLLVLIVRCGLKVFLENFIGPLMEAVGRYKDSSNEESDTKPYSDVQDEDSDAERSISNKEEDSSPEVEVNEKGIGVVESEIEVFSFDRDDCGSNPDGDEAVRRAVEHLDLNLPLDVDQLSQDEEVSSAANLGRVQSPEINIPGQKDLNQNIGRDKILDNHGSNQLPPRSKDFDKYEEDRAGLDFSQIKASDVAGDSIIWLAHRLGPVLTSRHLNRNLLRVLSLCYTGKDNLEPYKFTEADETNLWKLSVLKWKVVGDENAETVLRVLGEITELYGEQIILLQYLPFMSELINLSKKKFTLSLEGGIIGCMALLKYIVPFMNDSTLMDQLQDVILKSVIHPVVRLISSTRFVFPSGLRGRYTLVSKLIDCIYLISLRIGAEMTKVHLTVPALQRFFLAFDKAHGLNSNCEGNSNEYSNRYVHSNIVSERSLNDNRYLEIQRDGTATEWSVRGGPGEPISIAYVRSEDSLNSSPSEHQDKNKAHNKALTELKNVFDAQLAHQCYGAFFRFLGESALENALKNQNLIHDLYYQHEQEHSMYSKNEVSSHQVVSDLFENQENALGIAGSLGRNVAVIGNKIELQKVEISDSVVGINEVLDSDITALICRKKEDFGRHLRGNWLAYWEHEIGRSEKNNEFNFKQIKLQNFTSHTNSVRMIYCLDNENSFLSGSKDKTVKLWSLRSQGDGSSSNGCQFTYSQHRKSLLSLSFVQSIRIVASCDSTIHLWDPFEGKTISILDTTKVAPVNVLKALNPPSCNLVAATTDATLKIIDSRLCSFVSEYKVSVNSVGLIRSIGVSPSGNWIAVGQASGLLTVLDVRTGMVISSWKGHESEVLQLAAVSDGVLLSSSLDQTVTAWNVSDGKFKFYMKGPAEPVHCLAVNDSELITGTTANRIGVHTSIDSQASFSSTKLRSDTFKGILTSMTVLPLNKLLLLGADNGNITLLC